MNPITIFAIIAAGIYYVIGGLLTFFAIFGVYVLVRYGQSRSLSLIVSLVFCGLFLGVLSRSFTNLQSLF